MSRKEFFLALLNWFYPHRCAVCAAGLPMEKPEEHLCVPCFSSVASVEGFVCMCCGLPLPDGGMHCWSCKKTKWSFTYVRSFASYQDPIKSLILRLKYQEKKFLALDLAHFLNAAWKKYPELHAAQSIVPVPLHPLSERERGYNQSLLLAQEFVKGVDGLQLLPDVLQRVRATQTQTRLSREARLENMEDAFIVRDPQAVHGKNILLIDDVCTTGATLNACAKALKKSGAKNIFGLTLARD